MLLSVEGAQGERKKKAPGVVKGTGRRTYKHLQSKMEIGGPAVTNKTKASLIKKC